MAHTSTSTSAAMEKEDSNTQTAESNGQAEALSSAEMARMIIQQHHTNIWFGRMLVNAMRMVGRMGDVFRRMEIEGADIEQLSLGRQFSVEIDQAVQSLIKYGTVDTASFDGLNQKADLLHKVAEDEKTERTELKKEKMRKEKQRIVARQKKQSVVDEGNSSQMVEVEDSENVLNYTAVSQNDGQLYAGTADVNAGVTESLVLLGHEGQSSVRYYDYEVARGYVVNTSGLQNILGTLVAYEFHECEGSFICLATEGAPLNLPIDYVVVAKAAMFKQWQESQCRRNANRMGDSMGDVFIAVLEKFSESLPRPIHLPSWPMESYTYAKTVSFSEVLHTREPLLRSLIEFYSTIAPLGAMTDKQAVTVVKQAVEVVAAKRPTWNMAHALKKQRKRKEVREPNYLSDSSKQKYMRT